jgi:hypothetical protein
MSGMFGSAYRNGVLLSDAVAVSAPIAIGRITVPAVGSADESYKQGRTTREGTMEIQKIDTQWELEIFALLSATDDQRRAARDAGTPINPAFQLVVKLDDPEALGAERWQLDGVRMWNFEIGFSGGDDITSRQYQITWDSERPLTAFKRAKDAQGNDRASYVVGNP